ncbi:hypothetical protein V6N13_136450 [Hibiscus sabdariffa]|uniref:Histidine-containing phosphotransfer protein n=1 Tax=Hibiscus sabdariffa TaxID=183260 RepID=A0ABR2DRI9_9ROSI
MDLVQLQRQLVDYRTSLYHEGFLDEQFTQLQELQDENNPDFVVEVVSLYFEDSERLLNELSKALEQQIIDFKRIDAHVHQLKGSSSSIGAQRVQKLCIVFRNYCEAQNVEGCLKCLQQVKHEYSIVKTKLESMFQLERQILNAGGSVPV